MNLLGAQVGINEANVGLITTNGGHTGIHIDVVVLRDVVVPLSCNPDIFLSKERIPETTLELAKVIILTNNKGGRVDVVDVTGNIAYSVVLDSTSYRIDYIDALDITAKERSNLVFQLGYHPDRITLLIQLKHGVSQDGAQVVKS